MPYFSPSFQVMVEQKLLKLIKILLNYSQYTAPFM